MCISVQVGIMSLYPHETLTILALPYYPLRYPLSTSFNYYYFVYESKGDGNIDVTGGSLPCNSILACAMLLVLVLTWVPTEEQLYFILSTKLKPVIETIRDTTGFLAVTAVYMFLNKCFIQWKWCLPEWNKAKNARE
jgi:hypothetical protein